MYTYRTDNYIKKKLHDRPTQSPKKDNTTLQSTSTLTRYDSNKTNKQKPSKRQYVQTAHT